MTFFTHNQSLPAVNSIYESLVFLNDSHELSDELSDYKFSAADESTSRLHLKSSLRKRGVERVKLKTENYFPDREFDMDLA